MDYKDIWLEPRYQFSEDWGVQVSFIFIKSSSLPGDLNLLIISTDTSLLPLLLF